MKLLITFENNETGLRLEDVYNTQFTTKYYQEVDYADVIALIDFDDDEDGYCEQQEEILERVLDDHFEDLEVVDILEYEVVVVR